MLVGSLLRCNLNRRSYVVESIVLVQLDVEDARPRGRNGLGRSSESAKQKFLRSKCLSHELMVL